MAGHGTCSHDHSCEDHTCAADWSLYKHVDLPKVRALNEAIDGSASSVFKPWDQRLDYSTVLESNDDDPELMVHIPFTSDVKLKSICIIGGTDGSSPAQMRAFVNRPDMDFSSDLPPVQDWTLAENSRGELEYPTQYSRFQGVHHLTLHFPACISGDVSRIHFIGFKGEATKLVRDQVVNVVYEAMARPQDHKLPTEEAAKHVIQ